MTLDLLAPLFDILGILDDFELASPDLVEFLLLQPLLALLLHLLPSRHLLLLEFSQLGAQFLELLRPLLLLLEGGAWSLADRALGGLVVDALPCAPALVHPNCELLVLGLDLLGLGEFLVLHQLSIIPNKK